MTLHFCCNDRHGLPTGRVGDIRIPGAMSLSLVVIGAEPNFRIKGDRFQLSRRWFRHYGWTQHVGNIHWGAAEVSPRVAALVVNHALSLRVRRGQFKYDVEEAEAGLFDKARRRGLITADELVTVKTGERT